MHEDVRIGMSIWHDFWSWYFQPKGFETSGDGKVYRWLGIRYFKRYLPTSGDLVTRLRGKHRIGGGSDGMLASLVRYERVTRQYEGRHIFGAVSMLALSWWSIEVLGKGDWLILIGANIVINGYPIMLQRYNRARLHAAVSQMKRCY